MQPQDKFSCFVIGEGTLPIQCAEIILKQGHRILGIISFDKLIIDWAKAKSISHFQPTDELKTFLTQQPFDYLFSIVNNCILSKEIIELPRKHAINYHDAPLPRYAGVNATSWGLINQDKIYGITWHLMSDIVDAGDILIQVPINIAEDDTAFTLNGKCYETAIHSFENLIDKLSSGKVLTTKQNLDARTYFPRFQKPRAGGILSFNCCAYELDALVRALNFGPRPNPLSLPKLAIEGDLIIVSKLEVLNELSEFPPGTVTTIESGFLKVSTASYEVVLRQVLNIDGQMLSIPDLVTKFGLQVGMRLKDIDPEIARRIEVIEASIAKHEAFWVERQATLEPITILYGDQTISYSQPQRFEMTKMPVPNEVTMFLQNQQPSWNQVDFLLAAFVAYLARIGGTGHFDIGFRDLELQRELAGLENFFASQVSLRVNVDYAQSFEEFFEVLQQQLKLTKRRKTYARDALARYPILRLISKRNNQQIFPVAIERVNKLEDYQHQAKPGNDLNLIISQDGREWGWLYNAEVLDRESVARMQKQFSIFLQGIFADSTQSLAYLPLLSDQELHKIVVEWNDTEANYPKNKCIHQLFEEQVEKTPDSVAVVFRDEQLTYRQLNGRANQLAQYLQKQGVRPDILVGICLERSAKMVIALMAILKAGGAYVPLNPEFPKERLAFILEDTKAAVLLTQEKLTEKLPKDKAKLINLDLDWQEINQHTQANLSSKGTGENLAYVMYTSGSTGQPKGVAVTHRAVNRLVFNNEYLQLQSNDKVAQASNVSFDAATFEIWGALLQGGQLVGIPQEILLSHQDLSAELREKQITILVLTTALFNHLACLAPEAFGQLRCLFFGGETAQPKWVKDVLTSSKPPRHLIHVYGPTENTTFSTFHLVENVDETATKLSIGRPISNTQVFILDSHLQPVPIGVRGELYLGGDGLARGYLNRPELTKEKFIINPLTNINSKHPRSGDNRLYKTGDLARYLPDGNIEFLGRLDFQVKIRGFRIELEEIEKVIALHPQVETAVVLVTEDIHADKRLVAYIVSKHKQLVTSNELKIFLKQKLPDYMIPATFVFLDILPLTPNGKIDRRALPMPDLASSELEDTFMAPRTPVEEMLAQIWGQVLGLDKVGVQDNFFELGGHSLLATQIISRGREVFSVDLSISCLFKAPTIMSLGEKIEALRREGVNLQAPPLRPRKQKDNLPLSFAQQRLWFLDQLTPSAPTYNIPLAYRITGQLNVAALEQSLAKIVQRHEALRTTFRAVDGQPIQVIAPEIDLKLLILDLQEISESEQELEVHRLTTQEAQQPFDLAQGPLLRVKLLRLDHAKYVLCMTMHHIIADGWSVGVLMHELAALYKTFSTEEPSSLPELPIQYTDFALWQREWLSKEVLESQLGYWKKELGGDLPLLELPTDHPRPPVQTYRGAKQSFELSNKLTDALKALSRRESVSLFMTLLAGFKTLLYRYTGQEDIIIGSPIAHRPQMETHNLIGFFVNMLPIRAHLGDNPTFVELLSQVREKALRAYGHQDLPFSKLVEEIRPAREMSHSPIFQVMFALQNTPSTAFELPGLSVTCVEVDNQTAKLDLLLEVQETSKCLKGFFEYNTDLWETATIERMVKHFQNLLENIAANPDQPISSLPFLTADEQYQLKVKWNNTHTNYPKDKCIHQLFEEQVEKTPDSVAVVFRDEQLTYRQLNGRANQLAQYLQKQGVRPDILVGICLERSAKMVIALMAILKAGGAYVPLNPEFPKERLAFILEDTKAAVLLTQEKLTEKLPKDKAKLINLDLDWQEINQHTQDNPSSKGTGENLAYVMYTSGSTGQPKGVAVTHRAVNRLVFNNEYLQLQPNDKVAQVSNVSFDAATFEIWGTLLQGGQLVGIPQEILLSHQDLSVELCEKQITILFLTTALFNHLACLAPEAFGQLRCLFFGGETAQPKWVKDVLTSSKPPRHLIHVYGPTENTTFSTFYLVENVDETATKLSIGRPISNTQVFILDSHLQPVPIGVRGELYLGGDGLARGYLNRPDLTSAKFIINPLTNVNSKHPRSGDNRLYKTGDLARYLPDGNIEFLGRLDFQVKIRGFRIELEEIEKVIALHPQVETAVVLVTEDIHADKRLVAYIVSKHKQLVTSNELKIFLKQKLPDYMIPATFVFLDILPLTPNGKIDRRALPAGDLPRSPLEDTFMAPRTPVEEMLTKIWAEVLRLEKVGIQENFFELGGHSLLATQIISRGCEVFSVNLSISSLFEAPTIMGLAEKIEALRREDVKTLAQYVGEGKLLDKNQSSSSNSSLIPIQPQGSKPSLFCIHILGRGLQFYRPLAKYLGLEQPLYGLNLQLVNEELNIPNRVEDIAAHYVQQMRSFQPEGPYYLVGLSFGGTIAFEMAQQLIKDGQQVALLALLDTYGVNAVSYVPISQQVLNHWQNFSQSGFSYVTSKIRDNLVGRFDGFKNFVNVKFKKLKSKFFKLRGIPLSEELLDFSFQAQNLEAKSNYVPQVYPGHLTLFFSLDKNSRISYTVDPTLGWGNLAEKGLKIYEIPGSHLGMMAEPYVAVLAEKLQVCLEESKIGHY